MNIICTPSDAFDITSNNISLKQYTDDTLMYFKGTETDLSLTYAEGSLTPYNPTAPTEDVRVKQDETELPYTFIDNGFSLTYYKNNFRNFRSGCIRFTAKKEYSDFDYAYQDVGGFVGAHPGTYNIFLTTENHSTVRNYVIVITLTQEYDVTNLAGLSQAINNVIINNVELSGVMRTTVVDNKLRFRTTIDVGTATKGYLKLSKIGNEESIDAWFTKRYDPLYFSAPNVDTKVISFHEFSGTNNEISIIHKTDGFIYLFMSDETSRFTLTKKLCQWEWDNEDWTEFELNFDDSLSNFLANGKVKAFFETVGVNESGTEYDSIIRSQTQETYLTLVNGGDSYGFREIDVFNKKQHCGAYESPESVTEYDGTASLEYEYGDIKVFDDSKFNIETEGNILIEAFDSGVPLAYTDDDGNVIVVSSTNVDDFIEKFKNVDLDPNSTLSFESADLSFKLTFLSKDAKVSKFEFDNGTETYDSNDPYNFEDIYAWVRRQCGAPQIACELTDDQIYDALCRAVEKYNKYRNWNENINIADIGGTEETDLKRVDGGKAKGVYFQIPAHIADTDIIDIFFQPRFSTCWFGAGDTFLNNVMAQTFFGLYGGIVQNSADYYIWRVSCNDISNIIGTQVSWRIYDHHLYFTPNNLKDLDQFRVGIKYRPSLTVEEIRNNENIKALTLAYAMRTLGIIRGSFGGSVQAGDIAIQLNAETLLAEADKLEDKTIALLKSEQKPLWMIWT